MTFVLSNSEDILAEKLNRIEVCGGIASGKTTLANVMQCAGHEALFENFKLNPFIEKFYSDSSFYSFETEISFLLQHYSQIKTEAQQRKGFFCDYSLLLDFSYAEVTLKPSHLEIFGSVLETVKSEIGQPGLLIHLRCDPVTQLYRIRQRDRAMESGITVQYLESLNRVLEKRVKQEAIHGRVLEIDSGNVDFASDPVAQRQIVDLIRNSLQR